MWTAVQERRYESPVVLLSVYQTQITFGKQSQTDVQAVFFFFFLPPDKCMYRRYGLGVHAVIYSVWTRLMSTVARPVFYQRSHVLARLQTERVHHLVQTAFTVFQFCVSGGKAGSWHVRTLGEHVALQGDAWFLVHKHSQIQESSPVVKITRLPEALQTVLLSFLVSYEQMK